MTPAPPLVEVRKVWKSFGDKQVLRGVSFALPKGTILAVMGGSGTGKTVLLRIASGLARPDAGEVYVFGTRIDRMSEEAMLPLRRRTGFVFQAAALFDSLTVFENVAFPIREHTKLPEDLIHDLVLMKLNAVGLRGAHKLRPAELSGGMSRRVALARAIALDPDLIIYDEPFAGLDPITLNVVCDLIRTLNDALGATSVVVTYDVQEALRLADYLYLLNEGIIVAHGPTPKMVESSDPFVHQFLHAEPDGPVRFHVPAPPLIDDLEMEPAASQP